MNNKKIIHTVTSFIFLILISCILLSTAKAAEVSYYVYNAPGGSVTSLTNETQGIANSYVYNNFGSINQETETRSNEYKYNGEQQDNGTGLIFLRKRCYDPTLGRFITKDSRPGVKCNPQSLNQYVYCNNNPINYKDPDGEIAAPIVAGLLALWDIGTRWVADSYYTHNWGLSKLWNDPIYGQKATSGLVTMWLPTPFTKRLEAASYYLTESTMQYSHYSVLATTLKSGMDTLVGYGLEKAWDDSKSFFGGPPDGGGGGGNSWFSSSSSSGSYGSLHSSSFSSSFFDNEEEDSLSSYSSSHSLSSHNLFFDDEEESSFSSDSFGGVSLSKTADLMLNIQDVAGAGFDEATGQVILYGKQNTALPNMKLDDLAVAVRSVYGVNGSAEDPGISIGTEPSTISGQAKVSYYGDTFNTKFGSIMFDCDRLLKCITVGKDNISGEEVSSDVPGFKNVLDRFAEAGSASLPMQPFAQRFWFTPKEIKLVQSEDGSSMIFDTVTMQLLTETKIHLLAGTEFHDYPAGNPCAEAFASHFTQNYDAFAEERPILKELKRLGGMTAIVKWIKDNNIPFDLSFFENYVPQSCETPQYTPEISVSKSWTENNQIKYITLEGGVYYKLDASNFSTSINPLVGVAKQEAVNARPGDTSFMWNFTAQDATGQSQQSTAIAQSFTRSKKDGNIKLTKTDIKFPVEGDNPLALVRYYNSFGDKATGFGRGWQITPYALRFPDALRTFTFGSGALSVKAHYQIFVRKGTAEYLYTLSGLDANGNPVYVREGGSDLLKGELLGMIFQLYKRDGSRVIFDNIGCERGIVDRNGISVDYNYIDSKLTQIKHQSGAGISLNYDGDKITSVSGPSGRTVTYTYYSDGQLKTVTDPEGQTTTYYYDADKRINKIVGPDGNVVYQAAYDDYNRVSSETIGSAQYSYQFSLTDRTTIITGPNDIKTTLMFDTDYRLLQSENFLGDKTNMVYDQEGFGPSAITDPEGKVTEYKYDSLGNTCYIKDSQGNESFFFYNSNNNLVASRDKLGHDTTYLYDDKNRLIEIHHMSVIDYDPASGAPQNAGSYNQTYDPAYVTKFTYDNTNGNLLSITDTEGRAINATYNANGLPLTVATSCGYQITTAYDNLSRPVSISDPGGESTAFEYDNIDRVKKITTVAGSVNYIYDANGNIDTVSDGKNNSTNFGYNSYGKLVTVTDAEGGVTSYEYDITGSITKITMPNGSTKEITYDESGRPISEINRRADPAPQIMVLVTSLDFGSISAGTSVEKDITVYNVGDANLNITGISADNNSFTISPTSAVIPPHGQLTLSVTYMAPADGSSTGNLTISSNDSKNPTITIALSGMAVQQSLNTAATLTANGMLVTWTKYSGTGTFDHYSIYRSDIEITDITGLSPLQTIADVNQISYLDTTATSQNQYNYCVVAFDAASNKLTPALSIKPATHLNLGKIGDAIDLASSSHNEQNVAVVYNNTSREYLLVYEYDASGTGSNYDIYGQRLVEDGTKIGSAFPIFNSANNEKNPQVAWNSKHNEYGVVCEHDKDGTGTYVVRLQRLSATGSLLNSPLDSREVTYGSQHNPCVVYSSVSDRYVIGYDGDCFNTGKEDLVLLSIPYLVDGNSYREFSTGFTTGNFRIKNCKLAYNPSLDNFLVVFEFVVKDTNTYIVGDIISTDLNSIGNMATIGAFPNNDTQPCAYYDDNRKEYAVIWQFDNITGTPNEYQAMIRKVSSDGVPGKYLIYASSGKSFLWPKLACFGSQNEYLMTSTSLDTATNEYSITSQRISAVDLSILDNSEINVAAEPSVIERNAELVFNPNNNEFLIAYERQSGSDCSIRAQRIGEVTTLLDVDPASLDFAANLTEQTIQVGNVSGADSMSLVNSTNASWLAVSPATIDVENLNPMTMLTVSVDRTGLSIGNYSGYVFITCGGITSMVPVTMTVDNLPPNSPTSPTPATGTTGEAVLGTPLRVALKWKCTDLRGSALNYDIYLSDNQSLVTNADPSVLIAQSQTAASCISPALSYNKVYYWRVKSRNADSLAALGDVWSFTTVPIAAPVLIPPTINPVNTRKPIFQWNAVDGAALYNIQIADNPDFNSPIINVANIAATEYIPSVDLPEGTMYWRVAAIDAQGGEGAFSSSTGSNAIIIDVTPPPQVNLIAYTPDPTNNQKPKLTWNASIGASLYHVQIANASDFSAPLFNGYVSETSYTPASNLPEGKIWWRVSAKDLAGNESPYSTLGNFTIDITPPGPVKLISANGKVQSIEINWEMFSDTAGDFHHFNVYRSESTIANVSGMSPINQSITDKSVTDFIDTTVSQDKEYYYAVTVADTAGNEYKQVASLGPANSIRYGYVSGTVTDEVKGLPIAGIWVRAYDWTTNQLIDSVQTISDGTYKLNSLPPGDYRVCADTAGTDYISEYYDNAEIASSAQKISVALGVEVKAIDFALPALEQISVNLHVNFNPIGFAVLPQNLPSPYKASDLVKDMAGQGIKADTVMQWDGAMWVPHRFDLPFTDFNLDLNQGVFVSAMSDTYNAGTWTIKGRKIRLPKTFNLNEGWNLVNVPTTISTTTLVQTLQQINAQGGTADVMMWWDGAMWVSTQVDLPFTDQQLVKGRSYFIRCAHKSVWRIE